MRGDGGEWRANLWTALHGAQALLEEARGVRSIASREWTIHELERLVDDLVRQLGTATDRGFA